MEFLVIGLAVAVISALSAVQRHQRRSGFVPSTRTRHLATDHAAYPGDHQGRVSVRYAPAADGRPDPGEIVWTWVPFEEDHSRGKDRPVLLIGRDGRWLLGLQLSSRDPSRGPGAQSRDGRTWLSIGSGSWDRQRRPSTVRLDRIIRVDPSAVRREGAILDRRNFDQVARSLSELHNW